MGNFNVDGNLNVSGQITSAGVNILDCIAEQYDPTATYQFGDYCIYQNELYRCISAITTPEEWDSNHWLKVSIVEILSDGENAIEVIPYQTTTPLTDEQIERAQANKLAVCYDSELYTWYSVNACFLTLKTFSTYETSSTFSSVIKFYRKRINFDLSTKVLSLGQDWVQIYGIRAAGNDFATSDTPESIGLDSKKIVRALNLRKTQDMLANVYDTTATYAYGDYCIYQNELYKCVVDINNPEDWDSNHWVKTQLTNEIDSNTAYVSDTTTTNIQYTFQHLVEKTYTASASNIDLTVPAGSVQGFQSSVVIKTGDTNPTFSITNLSSASLKMVSYGTVVTSYTPSTHSTITFLLYNDLIHNNLMIYEVPDA